ncbi:Mu transposase C-terminal domain-containing protein [Streptomyces sp. NPDC050485]|uniref:Mu transposase C-terminal domain-containing protein n=1 Tax=Streptomyces sp. NPDC050485 TaxID=3365617 RepID=UPI0037A9EF23
MLPKVALTPNQMWAALVAVAGYTPVPLSGSDHLELLPVRWQAITERGIRLNHRTYDSDLLSPYRGQLSPITTRGGKWEVHTDPHDARQIWVRLPDGQLAEIPWIHREHAHHPFNDRTWHYLRTTLTRHPDTDQHEAELADALDQLMRRARTGQATRTEENLLARSTPTRTPPPPCPERDQQEQDLSETAPGADEDSLDALDDSPDEEDADDECPDSPAPFPGYGLYDAQAEALTW